MLCIYYITFLGIFQDFCAKYTLVSFYRLSSAFLNILHNKREKNTKKRPKKSVFLEKIDVFSNFDMRLEVSWVLLRCFKKEGVYFLVAKLSCNLDNGTRVIPFGRKTAYGRACCKNLFYNLGVAADHRHVKERAIGIPVLFLKRG